MTYKFKNNLAALWGRYESLYLNEKIFDIAANGLGQNLNAPFIELRAELKQKNIYLTTLDMVNAQDVNYIICIDCPDERNKKFKQALQYSQKKILVILETKMILPENYSKRLHKKFDVVFTWDDELVDGEKFLKSDFANYFDENLPYFNRDRKKLICAISNNKSISAKNGLYRSRLEFIYYCIEKIPEDFDLFGSNWETYSFANKYVNFLSKKTKLNKIIPFPPRAATNGPVENKLKTLSNYKFSLCLENASGYSGYITEKIFDCFFSGTIPIYAGAKNIYEKIPPNCFIDYSKFSGPEELISFIKSVSDGDAEVYRANIRNFLNSAAFIEKYTSSSWAKRLANEF